MVTKVKKLKTDRRGNYSRDLGWKLTRIGQRIQPRFYLGKDHDTALQRNGRLESLWSVVATEAESSEAAIWNLHTLEIAKAIARGEPAAGLPFLPSAEPDDEDYRAYAFLVERYARKFPMIAVLPADTDAFRRGREITDGRKREIIEIGQELFGETNILEAETHSLHEAIDDFIRWIKRTYVSPGSTTVTPWGNTQVKESLRLKEKHQDVPLARLDLQAIEGMVNLWKNRPIVKGGASPITPKTAANHIKRLKCFLWWLHRQEKYRWRIPPEVEQLATKIKLTEQEIQKKLRPAQVETYGVDELTTLYRYATPLERLYLLLGLNCGFSIAEFGTLRLNQIFLHQAHGCDELLNYQSTASQSWIKRLRIKTQVYGEFLLWPHTVEAIEWAIQRRKRQSGFAEDAALCLTDGGLPYYGQTNGGNNSTRIGNLWHGGVLRRIRKDYPDFRQLPPKSLRKTAGNFIREIADGEIMAVFHCRGQAVARDELADIYSNRPFAKVFRAIEVFGQRLRPMFDAVKEPFPTTTKKGGPNISLGQIEAIRQGRRQGKKVVEIAAGLAVAPSTVYRHIDG